MGSYKLSSYLNKLYGELPETHHRPLIGLTANFHDIDASIRACYYRQVVAAGGVPVIIPPVDDTKVILDVLENLDGLVLTGGGDHNPLWYDEQPSPRLHHINKERDKAELLMTRLAFQRQIPMLGTCRGMQTLALALGGKVEQDISTNIKHEQDADREEPTHSVSLSPGSVLQTIYQEEQLYVNSFHHQAVSDPGKHFRVAALSLDNVIEAMESAEEKSIIGVQWHPEWLGEEGRKLFSWLVERAEEFARAKTVNERVISIDSHCDTPMFFPQGIRFDRRDPRVLVDLHKMTEGRLDAVVMAAYLPQPKSGELFRDKVDFSKIKVGQKTLEDVTPKTYVQLIFDKIEKITKTHGSHVALAKNFSDLNHNKWYGKKSIMLAIENGLAIEDDIQNVKYFADRGAVYITLCHNGDNAICDSAMGNHAHHGISLFGEQVIREMNRNGVIVDLSHASEESFYDALSVSSVPVVCSHSNCRALCDVPRNLTDEQLHALAQKDGIVHITLYNGFLRKEGEASIIDAIDHLEHVIKIMGIDRVGLGTDFDGGGGVRGIADSSELINFTVQLLRRKYSERDISNIWGGNWIRVMSQVQAQKEPPANAVDMR